MKFLMTVGALLMAPIVFGQTPTDTLFAAAKKGDAASLEKALLEVNAKTLDADGTPVIIHATKSGDFETVKTLLWRGADPRTKDASGKSAIDYCDENTDSSVQLLLRCYNFVLENGTQSKGITVRNPGLAVVSDNYVDYEHNGLRDHYWINQAEKAGKSGVDDDNNGFIDDIYGWNTTEDKPTEKPGLGYGSSPEEKALITELIAEFSKLTPGNQPIEKARESYWKLVKGYRNPLVRQMGYDTFIANNIDMNDLTYAGMVFSASHGTHVAGIITQASEGKAKVHCGSTAGLRAPETPDWIKDDRLIKAINLYPDFEEFSQHILDSYRNESCACATRGSQYLKQLGAGVVNMSWGIPLGIEIKKAMKLIDNYCEVKDRDGKEYDLKDFDELQKKFLAIGFAYDLRIANAAAFALLMYENPNTLFVVASGNESDFENNHVADNDLEPDVPGNLSLFFPNVLTVASHGQSGKLSNFSNIGEKSVQISALGENIRSTMLAGNFGHMQGTSMASPMVAGVAAGLRADHPLLSAGTVRDILIRTAKPEESHKGKVASGGIMDAAAARKEATAEGTRRISAALADLGSLYDLLIKKAEFTSQGWAPAFIAGGPFEVRSVYLPTGKAEKQQVIAAGLFPLDAIRKAWDKGLRIDAMGAAPTGWSVVMGEREGMEYIEGLNQDAIAKHMEAGRFITAAAGAKGEFRFLLREIPDIKEQRYTMPTPLNDSRRAWIEERYAEGYIITSIAGDDDPKVQDDGYIFVMSKGAEEKSAHQIYSKIGPWPQKWINEMAEDGYGITAIGGCEDRYLVVMTKGYANPYRVSPGGPFNKDWFEGQK